MGMTSPFSRKTCTWWNYMHHGLERATSQTRLKACDHCILRSLIGQKKGECPSSLHTRRWSQRVQGNCHGWKAYMDSCMAYYDWCVMICQNLHHDYFQEVGLIQFPSYHVHDTAFGRVSRVLTTKWSRPWALVWSGPNVQHQERNQWLIQLANMRTLVTISTNTLW